MPALVNCPDQTHVLNQFPDPESIRNRLADLFAEVRLLRRVLPLAEEAVRLRKAAEEGDGCDAD